MCSDLVIAHRAAENRYLRHLYFYEDGQSAERTSAGEVEAINVLKLHTGTEERFSDKSD